MAQNMQFVYVNQGTTGTYSFTDNPSVYVHPIVQVSQRARGQDVALNDFFLGQYHPFNLQFDHIGTAQYAQLGTIFSLQKSIDFYPFDEVRGTAEKFTVRWVNDWAFEPVAPFWGSGFKGNILLEQV